MNPMNGWRPGRFGNSTRDADLIRSKAVQAGQGPTVDEVASFYEAAAPDFPCWSRGLNIHFGYWRRGIDPRDLEAMLEQMNTEVGDRLSLGTGRSRVLDIGCGMGATARSVARRYPGTEVTGFTVTPSQATHAESLNDAADLGSRIRIKVGDYHHLESAGEAAEGFDGAYAVESLCYAHSPEQVVRGLGRLLRPGARLVVADAFVPHERELSAVSRRLHAAAARRWRIPGFPRLPRFERALARAGFRVVGIEDISWRVAPSVLHVPGKVARLRWANGRLPRLGEARRDNAVAPLFGALVGLQHRDLRYQLVVAER